MQIGDDEEEDSDPQQLHMMDNSQGEVYEGEDSEEEDAPVPAVNMSQKNASRAQERSSASAQNQSAHLQQKQA